MSTRPRTQAAFIQGNQSTMEQDASHSALFYLFQEVSKLASPIHSSFLDTNSPSTWLNETSMQGPFIVKKEEEDAHSFQISNSSCQHSLSCMSPYNQMKVKEESYSSKVTTLVEPHPERNSPWKVLSMINLQCERLLHHSDAEESDPSSVSSTTKLGHLIDKASSVTDQGVGGDCVSVKCTLRPSFFIYERQEIPACVSPVGDVRGDCSGTASNYKPQCCVKDSKVGCCVQSQTAEKVDTVGPELVEESATASAQPQHRDKREDTFSVNRQFEWNQDCKDCFSTEQDILNVPVSENALSQTQIPNASPNTKLTFNSNEDASVALSKPALTLDHNANLALTTEPPYDTQLPPVSSILPSSQSASPLFSTTGKCHSTSKQDDKITTFKPECTHAPIEEKSPPVAQLKSSSYNGETNTAPSATSKPEPRTVQKEEIVHPSTQQWRTKTPRKQPCPSRSADIQDPNFQGVTFRIDTELDDSREQCRLLITSKYSKELCKSVRKPRPRARTSQKVLKTSSSDEESDPTTSVSKGKVCASCCTRKTPMWRDAEDGTPLCNACGIRYKKYRVRCINCWHIPRKEGNSNSCCLKCGNFVRLTSAQRKHTT
ncbi:GATA-type zinc finger protein 1 [Siniperca chuatsi]|uniref:GATA-type zinc finger protein 1 n=1 Tax=Siniperca chuatsi TaxID=119488 RepID=UPI001CE12177|nr:GATA-type zinc finger protein 1 [Siniperca chuatsi]XP_044046668.1 GATA-type zinc finger protein 1 [Siniperca chuatsi]XP_044046669.1 GATA-type zinc finger protein 1 [Siniperca chuatsi]